MTGGGALRAGVLTALSFAGFVGTSAALRPLAPLPEDYGPTPKLEYLREHADEVDVLVLGSSRVFRQVAPRVLDARLGELGHPLRTFNLGTAGPSPFELDGLLRRALAIDGMRPRYVLVEPVRWAAKIPEPNIETTRTVLWHTPRGTWSAFRASLRESRPLVERLEIAWTHLRLFGWWLSNRGQGVRLARVLLGDGFEQPLSLAAVEAERGYQPLDELEGREYDKRRARFLEDRATFASRVLELRRRNRLRVGAPRVYREFLASQRELVRSRGGEIVYLLPPGMVATPRQYRLHGRGDLAPMLAFNRPEDFPELYRTRRFFDDNHLNGAASEEFSERLAEALAAWIDGRIVRGVLPPPEGGEGADGFGDGSRDGR